MAKVPDIEQVFVQLVVTHQVALRAFICSMMPGNPNAEDLIQEVNVLVWEKRSQFEIGTNFRNWMFAIAKFTVLAAWRDEKRNPVLAVPEKTLIKIMEEAVEFSESEVDMRHDALKECITQLPDKERILILSRYIEGRSIQQVADVVGRKAESLKRMMHRIRLSLRSCVLSKINLERVQDAI